MTFQDELRARREAEAQRAAAAEETARAIAAEAGPEWSLSVEYEELTGVFYRARLEGPEISFWFTWSDRAGKFLGGISWPRNPGGPGRLYRDAPGVPWNAPEPRTAFAPDRPARTLWKQIQRKLDGPELRAARAAMLAADQAKAAEATATGPWLEAIARGAGRRVETSDNGSGPQTYFRPYDSRLVIDAEARTRRGTVKVDIPADPAEAESLLRAIRGIVCKS